MSKPKRYYILTLVDSVDREYFIYDREAKTIVETAGTLDGARVMRNRLNKGQEARAPKRRRKRRG